MTDDKLPVVDETTISNQIMDSIQGKGSELYGWLQKEEGRILSKALASLSSFLAGDPTGLLFPLILECGDYSIRTRLLKHFPDLMKRIEENKYKINKEFLQSEYGRELLRKTVHSFVNEIDEDKIEHHKKLFLNSVTKEELDKELISSYRELLVTLQPVDLLILRTLYQPETVATNIMIKSKEISGDTIRFDLKFGMRDELGIDHQLFERSVKRLDNENLISIEEKSDRWAEGSYRPHEIEEGIKTMSTSAKNMITDYGLNFIKFIIG